MANGPSLGVKVEIAKTMGFEESDADAFAETLNTTRRRVDDAIVVPKILGELFKNRYESAKVVYAEYQDDWRQAHKAFHITGSVSDLKATGVANENFVRSTTQTLIEYTYMQNPDATFKSESEADQVFADALQKTVTALVNKRNGMAINLRPKVQRAIMQAHLSNHGFLRLDYTPMKGSRQDVLRLRDAAEKKLNAAQEDDPNIAVYRETLDATTRQLLHREDFGIQVRSRSPFTILVDPDTTMSDLSDCQYLFDIEPLSDAYIKSEFLILEEETGRWMFKQDPTVEYRDARQNARPNTREQVAQEIAEILMPEENDAARREKLTDKVPCVWVWDRATRRRYLYLMDNWETPLWVFEDELRLSRFFPYFHLGFNLGPTGILQSSEVSYYIGFQNEINRGNKQRALLRDVAFNTFLFNTKLVTANEAKRVFDEMARPASSTFRGIGVELRSTEDKLEEVFMPAMLPVAHAEKLLDNRTYERAIGSATRITTAMQGGEYRTNTVSDAVQAYTQQAQTRVEGLIDPVEEMLTQLLWAIAEVVVSVIPKDQLLSIVDQDTVDNLRQMDVQTFNQMFSMSITAGSTEKPNSMQKKEEATRIIQMLGQFGTAAPRTVLGIVTRLLRRVFSRDMVSDKELETLEAEGQAAMQKGISTNGPQPQDPKG
jgi:hypothetical protein